MFSIKDLTKPLQQDIITNKCLEEEGKGNKSSPSKYQNNSEKPKILEGQFIQANKRGEAMKSKKERNFNKYLVIASRGINKSKDKYQAQVKTKENLDRLLEEYAVEEFSKRF